MCSKYMPLHKNPITNKNFVLNPLGHTIPKNDTLFQVVFVIVLSYLYARITTCKGN